MISNRYHGSIRLHFLLKLLGGMILFWAIVWGLHFLVYGERLLPSNYVWLCFLIPAAAAMELAARSANRKSLCGLSRSQLWAVSQREILFVLVSIFGVLVMSRDEQLSRVFLAGFVVSYALWITWMNQVGHRLIQRRLYRNSRNRLASTVVVAPPKDIEDDSAMRFTGNLPGADFVGYVQYGEGGVAVLPSHPILGDFERIGEICSEYHARMLLALGLDDHPELIRKLQKLCDTLGMRLIWVDNNKRRFSGNLDTHQNGSDVLLTNWREPLEDPMNRFAKRLVDLVIAGFVAVTVLPALCVLVWIIHRIFSPGPLFYKQPRTGRGTDVFDVYKFRTMHVNDTPGAQAKVGDSRIFPGGNFLRKASLDEFPQFINVLRGEMSVVGPRPHFVDHDEQFCEVVEDYKIRHFAKPGVTGLAQVRGYRGETDTDQKVRHRVMMDQFYLRNWSLLLDIYIILCTGIQVFIPPKEAR